jgi:hypothetical protein
LLNDTDDMNVQPKTDDDQMMGIMKAKQNNRNMGRAGRPVNAAIDWEALTDNFNGLSKEKIVPALANTLLQAPLKIPETIILQYAAGEDKNAKIRSAVLQLMSIPEYQMC